jgi:transcriptional regulator with XRE-family HTH domain
MASLTLIQGEALPVDDRVRAVVRMLLAAAGIKPVDLAERIGLSKNQVWDRLRGDKPFSVAEVVQMAELFDVPPSVFLMGPSALFGEAADDSSGTDKIVPGSIKDRGNVPGVSRHVTSGHLSLVAA